MCDGAQRPPGSLTAADNSLGAQLGHTFIQSAEFRIVSGSRRAVFGDAVIVVCIVHKPDLASAEAEQVVKQL